MVDLFPFSKYQREQIKYFSCAVGMSCHFMELVGGEVGDVWANARKFGADLKKVIDRGEYVDNTEMMVEGGWMHQHKFLARYYGHTSAFSIAFSHIGDIPHISEGTPWEVDDFGWTMNCNTVCSALTIAWGHTPSGDLVANISSNDGKIQLNELKAFGEMVKALTLQLHHQTRETT